MWSQNSCSKFKRLIYVDLALLKYLSWYDMTIIMICIISVYYVHTASFVDSPLRRTSTTRVNKSVSRRRCLFSQTLQHPNIVRLYDTWELPPREQRRSCVITWAHDFGNTLGQMGQWVSECVSWVSEWVDEWVSEWVSVGMSEKECAVICCQP